MQVAFVTDFGFQGHSSAKKFTLSHAEGLNSCPLARLSLFVDVINVININVINSATF